jgi:hypothetical protein
MLFSPATLAELAGAYEYLYRSYYSFNWVELAASAACSYACIPHCCSCIINHVQSRTANHPPLPPL